MNIGLVCGSDTAYSLFFLKKAYIDNFYCNVEIITTITKTKKAEKTKRNDTQDDDSGVASCRGLWASTCFASNNLAGVEIVDTNGHLVSKVHGEGSSQLITKITQGIQVVLVNMEGANARTIK